MPVGTAVVWFKLGINDGSTGQYIQFRKKGNSNWVSSATDRTQTANIGKDGIYPVLVDSDRICEYRTSNTTFTAINFVVVGWELNEEAQAGPYNQTGYPLQFNMFTKEPDAVGQGTWINAVNALYPYNGSLYNSSDNDGDNFSVDFRVPAGTYKLRFNFPRRSSRGIVDVYVDALEVGSIDGYNAATDHDYIAEITGITITDAAHVLKFEVDGHNASSIGYFFTCSGMVWQRTGD